MCLHFLTFRHNIACEQEFVSSCAGDECMWHLRMDEMASSEIKRNEFPCLPSSEWSVWHYGTIAKDLIAKRSQISRVVCGHCSPGSLGECGLSSVECVLCGRFTSAWCIAELCVLSVIAWILFLVF